jgi:hypothetical protein
VGQIHNRMPVIVPTEAYERWLANIEPDPRDLLVPYPSDLMKKWPISTRVNKPEDYGSVLKAALAWVGAPCLTATTCSVAIGSVVTGRWCSRREERQTCRQRIGC